MTQQDVDVAPATFSFNANAAGGTEPYTVNWNFGDDSEESDVESVVHTFDEILETITSPLLLLIPMVKLHLTL